MQQGAHVGALAMCFQWAAGVATLQMATNIQRRQRQAMQMDVAQLLKATSETSASSLRSLLPRNATRILDVWAWTVIAAQYPMALIWVVATARTSSVRMVSVRPQVANATALAAPFPRADLAAIRLISSATTLQKASNGLRQIQEQPAAKDAAPFPTIFEMNASSWQRRLQLPAILMLTAWVSRAIAAQTPRARLCHAVMGQRRLN